MRSPFYFIVKPLDDKRYTNTKNIEGVEFVTNTSEENHKASNRQGVVVAVPLGYNGPIKIGDILLVHHNVFKFYNDMKGRVNLVRVFSKTIYSLLKMTSSLCTNKMICGIVMTGIVL